MRVSIGKGKAKKYSRNIREKTKQERGACVFFLCVCVLSYLILFHLFLSGMRALHVAAVADVKYSDASAALVSNSFDTFKTYLEATKPQANKEYLDGDARSGCGA